MVMRRLLLLLVASAVAVVALFGVDSIRDTTDRVVSAGQGVIDAGQAVIETGQGAIEAGQGVMGQAQDTADAARQLEGACVLAREAVQPGTTPADSASLFQQAMAIVGGVVVAYPDVPGMAELEGSLGVAREALAADPTGQSLGVTGDAVNSACARSPTLP